MTRKATINPRKEVISLEVTEPAPIVHPPGTTGFKPILRDEIAQMRTHMGNSGILAIGPFVVTCTGRGWS
jgi:hypothetical protein